MGAARGRCAWGHPHPGPALNDPRPGPLARTFRVDLGPRIGAHFRAEDRLPVNAGSILGPVGDSLGGQFNSCQPLQMPLQMLPYREIKPLRFQ
jgi:hypothetical protein